MSGDNMIYSIHKKCKLSILLDDKGIFGIDMIEVDAPSGHIHWDNFFDAHRAVSLEFYHYWMYTTVSKVRDRLTFKLLSGVQWTLQHFQQDLKKLNWFRIEIFSGLLMSSLTPWVISFCVVRILGECICRAPNFPPIGGIPPFWGAT